MEGMPANLLEQLNFRWSVIRIQSFLNADLFLKCCYCMFWQSLHLWFGCMLGLGLWKLLFFNWGGVECINLGGLSTMEGISANLLEQLNFRWNVIRIQSFLNADLFLKCCYCMFWQSLHLWFGCMLGLGLWRLLFFNWGGSSTTLLGAAPVLLRIITTQYHAVLKSITPVLMCATRCYSSTVL